jgi:predicted phosphodiesterase
MTAAVKRLFRIQYVSDLHLEFYDKLAFPLLVKPAARYLALAGDIGRPGTDLYKSFIDYTARNWDRVFLVAGNHEYYAKQQSPHWKDNKPNHMFEVQQIIKSVCSAYSNVYFLHHDNPSIYLPEVNVAVIGATLWSHIPDDFKTMAVGGMNDYKLVPFEEDGVLRSLSPDDTNKIHEKEKAMLESQIDYWGAQKARVCVLTHHMPSYSLISPRYESNPYNCCFASHCDGLMKPHVRAWIYGHTHNAGTGIIKNSICAVNARGYPHESVPGFSREAWLEFKIKTTDEDGLCDELSSASVGIRSPFLNTGVQDVDIEFM